MHEAGYVLPLIQCMVKWMVPLPLEGSTSEIETKALATNLMHIANLLHNPYITIIFLYWMPSFFGLLPLPLLWKMMLASFIVLSLLLLAFSRCLFYLGHFEGFRSNVENSRFLSVCAIIPLPPHLSLSYTNLQFFLAKPHIWAHTHMQTALKSSPNHSPLANVYGLTLRC